jgi:hypothetical protein
MKLRLLFRWFALSAAFASAGGMHVLGATVRGQLVCQNGKTPATGIAVTLNNTQTGRSTPAFTGGSGMYYLTAPAGQYTIEIWLSKQSRTPSLSYPAAVKEPQTDIPRIPVSACTPQ